MDSLTLQQSLLKLADDAVEKLEGEQREAIERVYAYQCRLRELKIMLGRARANRDRLRAEQHKVQS